MKKFDVGKNIVTLLPEWVSHANAKQRSGRAGRFVPPENYYVHCVPTINLSKVHVMHDSSSPATLAISVGLQQ